MFPLPSIYLCVARVWLREIGFSLTYGALMLKTWRWVFVFAQHLIDEVSVFIENKTKYNVFIIS